MGTESSRKKRRRARTGHIPEGIRSRSFRNGVIAVVLIAAAVLIAVRINRISNVSLKTEAAETRLYLEAMENQDVSAIQEEIDLKRSVEQSSSGEH